MYIAQVAPLHESIPPQLYGGTERVVSYLTEELVKRGHDVTLYASGDSRTSAKLIPLIDKSFRLNPVFGNILALNVLQLELLLQDADVYNYDIIHFHTDYLHFPLSRRVPGNQVTTLHGRLDLPELTMIFNEYKEIPVVSISDNQRLPLPMANWQGTVYNGIDATPYTFQPHRGRYLAFLGRISQEKGVEEAIEIALRCGMELRIAAKIDSIDKAYCKERIEPFFKHPLISYIGEINELEKSTFLGNAAALLFPIRWPEPFGLVMIESLVCGTPVIAFNKGSVPEILENFVNGFIVNSVDEAVAAVGRLGLISRHRCRETFDKRFSVSKMVDGYLEVYHNLLSNTYIPSDEVVYQHV
ncbi:glycosyltransferase family 4 protein [Desulfosediminicola flagellatus]|uniref:glycosyltransferase family 4 protein n=1 Tax=Desulfosediminicola flagellatus TaxID=2569541 RepID=UPI0010ACB8C2|nr:glycosyltransferase family 4 protein [Desulfosediminicola flagellatus]